MYKKITHHIVEEHFEHPMSAHIKALNDGCIVPPPPPQLSMEKIYSFRSDTRALLAKYFWRIRSYIVSVLDSGADEAALQERISRDISKLGQVLVPYYGTDAAATFTRLMVAYTTGVLAQVKAVNEGLDTAVLNDKTTADIDALAKCLAEINPDNWPEAAVAKILSKLTSSWIDQAMARKQSDWISDFLAADEAQGTFITDTNSFSDIFVNGIIQQFPDKF
jgi:hypothetical protein